MSLINDLKRHEGFRDKPYVDKTGHLTIGYGWNLDSGITQSEATYILESRVLLIKSVLRARLPFWQTLTKNRQDALTNMAFNLGMDGFLEFKQTLHHLSEGEYDKAADQMLKSIWAKQVGNRAVELSDMIRKG